MLTITITPRAILLVALIALAGVLAFYATDALGSSTPDAYIQGDTDCDGDVDADDALNDLRYVAGLTVGPFDNCPEIGTEAAIPGPPGEVGPPGPPGLSDIEIVFSDSEADSNDFKTVSAECPNGKELIAGGASLPSAPVPLTIIGSAPDELQENTWQAQAREIGISNATWMLRSHAICANVTE